MAFPRVIALAERAWAREPEFARIADPVDREAALAVAWNEFANALGQRELPRLHELVGTVRYRVPPPGAIIRDGKMIANVAYPGLQIGCSNDGSEPTAASPRYDQPIKLRAPTRLRVFDSKGHGSRSIDVSPRSN